MNEPEIQTNKYRNDIRTQAIDEAIAAVRELKGTRNFPGENPTPEYDATIEDALHVLCRSQRVRSLTYLFSAFSSLSDRSSDSNKNSDNQDAADRLPHEIGNCHWRVHSNKNEVCGEKKETQTDDNLQRSAEHRFSRRSSKDDDEK